MDNEILYDFKAALAKIIESHNDMKLVISKWREMLDSTARDVEFVFANGDRVVVPNIEKIVQTINERTLPSDAVFNSVTAATSSGRGKLAADSVSFSGAGGDMVGGTAAATYGAYGTCGTLWGVSGEITLKAWPVPRYWNVTTTGQAHVHISPSDIKIGTPQVSEFFVIIDEPDRSLKLTLNYHTYEGYQTMVLNCPAGSQPAIWHVIVKATAQAAGTVVTGSATMLGKGV